MWGIKKIVTNFNMSKDLSVGRKIECSSSALFLKNPLIYKNKYHILEPFRLVGRFRSTDARKSFFKALLDNCPYLRRCIFCYRSFKDLLNQKRFACQGLSRESPTLLIALKRFLGCKRTEKVIIDKHKVMSAALGSKSILEAFTDFLELIKY